MKIFFMHIPKTAGTSFRMFLQKAVTKNKGTCSPIADSYNDYEAFISANGHTLRRYDLIYGHLPYHVRDLLPPETVVVTILREPIERCVSHIKHQIAHEQRMRRSGVIHNVNEFIAAPTNEPFLRTLSNLTVKYFSYHGSPSAPVAEEDLSVELAIANCQETWFGFTEEINEFQSRLSSAVFRERKVVSHVALANRSKARFTVSSLSPANLARLQQLNRLDQEFYRRVKRLQSPRSELQEPARYRLSNRLLGIRYLFATEDWLWLKNLRFRKHS